MMAGADAWGHSLIVDPWGDPCRCGENPGISMAEIDIAELLLRVRPSRSLGANPPWQLQQL